MPEISPAPRVRYVRTPVLGLIRALITFTMLMFLGCDDANASETGRTYRPLHADCPVPPVAGVRAGTHAESGDLAAAMFFDEDETFEDSEELDDFSGTGENLNPGDFNEIEAIESSGTLDTLLAEEDGEWGEPAHGMDALDPSETTAFAGELGAHTEDDFVHRRGDVVEDLLAIESAELDDAEHPDGGEAAAHPHPEPARDAPATPPEHAEHDDQAAARPAAEPQRASPAEVVKIDINTATEAELTSIRGIGPALAARILDYRSRRRFTRLTHLKRVKGIGPATYSRLEPYITIGPHPDSTQRAGQN